MVLYSGGTDVLGESSRVADDVTKTVGNVEWVVNGSDGYTGNAEV